jgi:hypothetical protein
MSSKYAGAMLKATKVGGRRYTTVKSLNKARALVQAAEKASHGKVIQASEIYRDDLIEVLVDTLMEKDKCDDKKDDKDDKKDKKDKKENPFAKFKKKKKKDDEEDDD